MEEFFDSGIGKILRWFLFIPVSFLLYFLSVSLLNLLFYFFWAPMHYEESMFTYLWREVLSNGLGGFIFVYTGCYIVPNHKKYISIILATIFILLVGLIMFGAIGMGMMFEYGQFEGWKDIIAMIASAIGAGIASYGFLNDEYY